MIGCSSILAAISIFSAFTSATGSFANSTFAGCFTSATGAEAVATGTAVSIDLALVTFFALGFSSKSILTSVVFSATFVSAFGCSFLTGAGFSTGGATNTGVSNLSTGATATGAGASTFAIGA